MENKKGSKLLEKVYGNNFIKAVEYGKSEKYCFMIYKKYENICKILGNEYDKDLRFDIDIFYKLLLEDSYSKKLKGGKCE